MRTPLHHVSVVSINGSIACKKNKIIIHLVASATLAAKAVVSSEGFGVGYGWVVSDSQAGALRLPRLRARTFLFVASATLAAKAGVGQAH